MIYRGFMHVILVPGAGIEPARLAAGDFESPASTNFTTRAFGLGRQHDWLPGRRTKLYDEFKTFAQGR